MPYAMVAAMVAGYADTSGNGRASSFNAITSIIVIIIQERIINLCAVVWRCFEE